MKKIIGYTIKEEFSNDKAVGKIIAAAEGYMELKESIVESNQVLYKPKVIEKLKGKGILDYFFKPVYEVRDWVIRIVDYGGMHKKGRMLKIKSIHKDTFKAVQDESGNHCIDSVRLATEDEILNHLQKEFTKKTGIDVGSNVIKDTCTGNVNKFFLVTENNYTKYSIAVNTDYASNKEKYLLGVKYEDYISIANTIRLNPQLTFGGEPVTLKKVSSGIRITCKGETGTLSQLEAVYNFYSKVDFSFGSAHVKSVTFSKAVWFRDDVIKPTHIKIGCTEGTWKELTTIIEEAKKLNTENEPKF